MKHVGRLHSFWNAPTFIQADTAQLQAVSVTVRIRYTFRSDVIYNAGSRFQSLEAENPTEVRQQEMAVKITYSWSG
jgi:hypothetical protein